MKVDERYKIIWNYRVIVSALVIIAMGVFAANVLSYILEKSMGLNGVIIGTLISLVLSVIGNLQLLRSQKIAKIVKITLEDTISMRGSVTAIVKDKDGNIKQIINDTNKKS